MGISIYYEKLNDGAKNFLEKNHNVPEAKTFAEGPFVEDKITPVEEITAFEGLNGEVAVGDQSAFSAFLRIAQKQNLSASQMPKGYELPGREEIIEEVSLPSYEPMVPVICPTAPEMGC
jgi:hypothetical protein